MKHAVRLLSTGSAIAVAMTASAFAADLAEPQIIETPVYEAPERVPASVSGWYIRGDVGYSWNKFRGLNYATYPAGLDPVFTNDFATDDLKSSFSIGAGIGYQLNHYARVDATLDYDFKSDFDGSTTGTCDFGAGPVACSSSDETSFTALTVLANAYVDLGTYSGFTPYVGAGIGGARVHWADLENTECADAAPATCNPTTVHEGSSDWRFAYALMAGVSYEFNSKLAIDVGYRYKRIESGHMFGYANGAGPGYDEGLTQHQVRAGLRYKFGGGHHAPMTQVAYEPTPVYK